MIYEYNYTQQYVLVTYISRIFIFILQTICVSRKNSMMNIEVMS